jgi:hypothetical protein
MGKVSVAHGVRRCLFAGLALAASAAAEPGGEPLPTPSSPALTAAPLFYAFVPSAFGTHTWAEREFERIRLGVRDDKPEDLSDDTAWILAALHGRTDKEFDFEPEEEEEKRVKVDPNAPPVPDDRPVIIVDMPVPALSYGPSEGAFAAIGLLPEDLVQGPEVPYFALTLAEYFFNLYDWGVTQAIALRRLVGQKTARKVPKRDPSSAFSQDSLYEKPNVDFDKGQEEPPIILSPRVLRSVYKILLGLTIGVLFWGFVRNTG